MTNKPKVNNLNTRKYNYSTKPLFIVTPQKDGSKKSTRTGVWVTNLDASCKNIEWLVKGGRSRSAILGE